MYTRIMNTFVCIPEFRTMSSRLTQTGPAFTNGITQERAETELSLYREDLFQLQHLLFAEQKHSLLIILQGMDASGKDGTIRHVFSSMNPMGVNVKAFKSPTPEEQSHDFLWRIHPHAPARGMISIFNRSHYEDILVPAVHKLIKPDLLKRRYERINSFEQGLLDSGTLILKFFLHISREEQKKRLDERIHNPRKMWKYDPADTREAPRWNAYMQTYEQIFKNCSSASPWHIIPSNHKWYRNYRIALKITETLEALQMKYPKLNT
ncbi:MAG TPA: PPK2 family polyphosphate kinase [Bacteroidia bacterium]|jgi:PPK2 family polyphosphate:nucleotide phosphotransferase|nr:PPK2 family polyphosphate kinase [Bacteroidia bacterium]